ncbi:pseudouridine-5'-phosphate glycosidase [Caldisalinibacter kiritimatiensis]|uniref:Pseudouridine-5'-phosphate glycosidase n=1 Tax=Caldisalinibacter kiritimatiensis TaxID=1304284 RepID=R1CPT3_9FIRM|nr:pseudouridine-5'-phosphate glycosidase [Caldisalinibacter kiritimatiensis]EOD00686.1 Pseudouridine 5'-phosphate glycosidase [Caldisalinibacter kiritimatiensis]
MLKKYLDIKPEVKKALDEGRPVVALESTIISHGMPYPQNVETAKKVEEIVRRNGAVPATIGIIDGKLKIGLNAEELEFMATSDNIAKASRRDLPFIIAKKINGATTVAATMIISAIAGIKVFVTGGIGGVHRNAQETFDISADLMELANTNVAVVCAGAKSILDIGLTLEYLETHGVPVIGYKTDEFPAFYTRKSGFKVDYKVDSVKELATAIKTKWDLDLKGGLVIGNPIPEEYQMDYDIINNAIEDALKESMKLGIKGKETTPFLLDKIKSITSGKSLESNIGLVYNNAKVGAKLAAELSKY